jgi:hypothetical protein
MEMQAGICQARAVVMPLNPENKKDCGMIFVG